MILSDIRSNRKLVEKWASVFHSEEFRNGIWQMLQDTHPLRIVETAPITPSSAEKKLGEIQGYEVLLERLRLCAQFQEQPGELPAPTFLPPENE